MPVNDSKIFWLWSRDFNFARQVIFLLWACLSLLCIKRENHGSWTSHFLKSEASSWFCLAFCSFIMSWYWTWFRAFFHSLLLSKLPLHFFKLSCCESFHTAFSNTYPFSPAEEQPITYDKAAETLAEEEKEHSHQKEVPAGEKSCQPMGAARGPPQAPWSIHPEPLPEREPYNLVPASLLMQPD